MILFEWSNNMEKHHTSGIWWINGPNEIAVTPTVIHPNFTKLKNDSDFDELRQQYTFNKYTIYTGLTYTNICFMFNSTAKQKADFRHFSSHIYAMLSKRMPKSIPLYWKWMWSIIKRPKFPRRTADKILRFDTVGESCVKHLLNK